MSIAGIDLSSHAVDCVLIDENTRHVIAWHRWTLDAKGDAFDRTRWVRDSMPSRGWWADEGVVAAGIEDPRGQSAGVIYRVQGAILSCLPTWLLVHPLVPSEWRKLAGLSGNSKKPDIRQASNQHCFDLGPGGFNYIDWPQDAHDAHLIARATAALLERQAAA